MNEETTPETPVLSYLDKLRARELEDKPVKQEDEDGKDTTSK